MAQVVRSDRLEDALIAQGLVPKNCRLLEVVMAPQSVPILRFEVFVTNDDLAKLAVAFASALGQVPS